MQNRQQYIHYHNKLTICITVTTTASNTLDIHCVIWRFNGYNASLIPRVMYVEM